MHSEQHEAKAKADGLDKRTIFSYFCPMAGKLQRAIFGIAEDNYGYVTVAEATEVGVSRHRLADLARLGSLDQVSFGVYRIVDFPASELDSYFAATLWPQGTRGVLSHETALDLWDLCDVNPAKLHLTVPRGHRVRREVPALYKLHHTDLSDDEITLHEGIPITTVERTLWDCLRGGTRRDLLLKAIDAAMARNILSDAAAMDLRGELATSSNAAGRQATSNVDRVTHSLSVSSRST